jgi:hypothetical protein
MVRFPESADSKRGETPKYLAMAKVSNGRVDRLFQSA